MEKNVEPPFRPKLNAEDDTSNFDSVTIDFINYIGIH